MGRSARVTGWTALNDRIVERKKMDEDMAAIVSTASDDEFTCFSVDHLFLRTFSKVARVGACPKVHGGGQSASSECAYRTKHFRGIKYAH